jgi:hypothetical protein
MTYGAGTNKFKATSTPFATHRREDGRLRQTLGLLIPRVSNGVMRNSISLTDPTVKKEVAGSR